mmetsp:Transcript_10791/g.24659  ORF Transcript_10791/g.24659 Transcript_10791/m.24659 type:complete len:88 (-) Transcript_10791:79-342(-)
MRKLRTNRRHPSRTVVSRHPWQPVYSCSTTLLCSHVRDRITRTAVPQEEHDKDWCEGEALRRRFPDRCPRKEMKQPFGSTFIILILL